MKHLIIKSDSDTLEVTQLQNDEFTFEIDEPWAGDSETGFGRTGRIHIEKEQAIELRDFLNKLLPKQK